jgi:N-acetyl sugar amidotransferase
MIRCKECVMPLTRPDTPSVDGICQACLNYKRRPEVDWHQRGIQLAELLDRFHGECIVPSSGGKDSTYQAIKLKAMGAHVTAVTARTCHLTAIGRANIDNLARHVKTIEVTPDMTVRAKLNRLGMEMVGDISWPEHVAIFTTPFNVAAAMNIPLIMYGENPQDQYGGPMGSERAAQMTARWRSEFGGFLGLRPSDMATMTSKKSMRDYELSEDAEYAIGNRLIQAHFLGAYIPWDSHHNAEVAAEAGMIQVPPSIANWWPHENLDNAQTGIHDHQMYRKYGYGRGCAQISVDVRTGIISRERALEWVNRWDGAFPHKYMGIDKAEILSRIGMTEKRMWELLDQFTNKDLFDPDTLGIDSPRLKPTEETA